MTMLETIMHPRAALEAVSTRALVIAGAAMLTVGLASVTFARQTYQVSQEGRVFSFKELAISPGDVVQFVNDDRFIHQIVIDSPTFKFDSPESQPGTPINVQFPVSGTFEVRCHIHPKMLMVVTVK